MEDREYIAGHPVGKHASRGPHDSSYHYHCTRDDCHIHVKSEHDARRKFISIAKEYDCPAEFDRCMDCGCPISPLGNICWSCYKDVTPVTGVDPPEEVIVEWES
jgi:hypothetical protein